MEEIWKDVIGYEGFYQVSNLGRVRSLDRISFGRKQKGGILKPTKKRDGYMYVTLCNENGHKKHLVHRLVAQSFISNPNNLPFINHKDEKPVNNCVTNLEWCDCKYNVNYGTCKERIALSRSKPISQYELNGKFIRNWDSCMQVEKEIGYDQTSISKCCLQKEHCYTAYGFQWRFYDGSNSDIEPYKKQTPSFAKQVIRYDLDMNFIDEWPSAAECQKQTGFCAGNILNCCKGKYKQAYGYIWKYAS